MEIYTADVSVLAEEEVFVQKMAQVPKARRERILRYQKEADRQRSLGAGLLLAYGLRRHGYSLMEDADGMMQVSLTYGLHGKPCLPSQTGLFFNLSHAGEMAVAVFSDTEAGIDVECIRTPQETLVKRVFNSGEQEVLRTGALPVWMPKIIQEKQKLNADLIFTGMWTRKESYIKAVGEGLHLPLAAFDVTGERILADEDYALRTWSAAGGYFFSVCAKSAIDAEPVNVDLTKI